MADVKGVKKGTDVRELAKKVAEAAGSAVKKGEVKGDPKKEVKEVPKGTRKELPGNEHKGAKETLIVTTAVGNGEIIRKIVNSVGLTVIQTKSQTPSGKGVIVVKIEVLAETLRKLKELKKVLAPNLPTAINRVELDKNGLVFEFYVKWGRGPIYVKRAKAATGIVCRSAPAKKKTTAGDNRSVHLVTLNISASKVAASQVAGLWKLLKYKVGGPKA